MLATIIKYYSISYFTFYMCLKSINLSYKTLYKISAFLSSFLLAILSYFLETYMAETKYLLPAILLWIMVSIFSKSPRSTFVISIISFVINCCLHGIASFIISFISFALTCGTPVLSYASLAILSCILHGVSVLLLLKIKRLKNGLLVLSHTPLINFATILCLAFCIILTQAHLYGLFALAILVCTLLLAFLIYWWQAQITKSYRRSLELRELESLRTELQEKNATIVKVMEENERIRHINHRDNGLITALDYAVNDYLVTDFTDETAAKARRDELLIEIERIRAGRVSSVNKDKVKATRYETNISLLNILLNQTSKRATDEHVLFSVHFGTELEDFIPRIISEDDLAHLLSDMLENAFIATRDVKNPMIQLQFYKWNKHFVIEIADNGIPFEVDSILNMGISELTTHADTGGSGIGLMDIWSTKEKYGATYHIDEYETPAPFSKKISLTFDKKNRYSVRTWRKDEILAVSKRADLQVYGQDE